MTSDWRMRLSIQTLSSSYQNSKIYIFSVCGILVPRYAVMQPSTQTFEYLLL
jgi:hypothetical protein